jgi:hypothetical protein
VPNLPPPRLATFVPTARLAQLLIISRCESNRTLDEITGDLDGQFSVGQLKQLEAAVLPITDDELRRIAKAYNLDFDLIAPARGLLVVDLTAKTISIDDYESEISSSFSDQDILVHYLALLYKFRHKTPGEDLDIRDPDIKLLREILLPQAEKIPQMLHELIRGSALRILVAFEALRHRPSVVTMLIEQAHADGLLAH